MRRSSLLLAVALAGLARCEQRFSSSPPPVAPESLAPVASSGAVDPRLAPTSADAGVEARDSSRDMTITLCSASPLPCASPDAGDTVDAAYRVVFGSGRAEIRTRGQAMADLYKELRDRTASGEELVAESRAPGDAGAPVVPGRGATTKADASGGDAIAQCAFHLLDLVDGVGEVTLDVVHGYGSHGCMVSLGRASAGAGASRCLIDAPDHPSRGRR